VEGTGLKHKLDKTKEPLQFLQGSKKLSNLSQTEHTGNRRADRSVQD